MGKRGPQKGVTYKKCSLLNEVKVVLHRRQLPKPSWDDTVLSVYKELAHEDELDRRDRQVRVLSRRLKSFENVLSEQGVVKAKELEKLINGGRITGPLWKFSHKDKEQFCITFRNSDWSYVFPKSEFEVKWLEACNFLRTGTVADWMVENANLTEAGLSEVWKELRGDEEIRVEILKLRGNEHLHVVSILKESAELVTGKEMFEHLNQREQYAIEMIMSSMGKDKSNP
mgnify:CR=1 FL=1|tara:strand:- start:2860 stop:3543 length:684 start_codon:yes stop_codon:yes gene_type:complete